MCAFRVLATAWALAAGSTCAFARAEETPARTAAVEDLPAIPQLPNPFVFRDGSAVRSRDDWDRRRRELKTLFEEYEYGHMPPKPERMTVTRGAVRVDEATGVGRQVLDVTLEQGGRTLVLHVNMTLPRQAVDADGVPVPAPVVVQGGFGRPLNPPAAAKEGTGAGASPRPDRSRLFSDRGYAVAELNFQEAAVDNKDRARTAGVYRLFGADIDCGALMAWAWGIARVIDALEADPRIDPRKVVVTGHSRYGKAALLAGAFDERIALTVPSHSGSAGAAPFRFIYGKSEQLHNIAGFAPYWFRPDFPRFVGHVDRLPIDQHLLRALVAPRPLLATEGTQDAWTNPQGSQLTHLAAARVYEFLGVPDRLGIRYRPVGHIPSNEDLLDFADHVFAGKPLPEEFGKLPYPEEKEGFDWDVPR